MIRGALTILSFVSTVLFSWPLSVIIALAAAFFEPMVPLAVGLFADTLYYTPQASAIPAFTLYGAIVTAIAFFVRSRLSTGIINK